MVELILALTRTADWRMGTVPHLVSTLDMTLSMEAQVSWARGSERISAPTLAHMPWSGKGKEISPHFPCQLHQAGRGNKIRDMITAELALLLIECHNPENGSCSSLPWAKQ